MRKVMKLIPLTQGLFTQVDDCDFAKLAQHSWSAARDGNTFYAIRKTPRPNRRTVRMHREIMGATGEIEIDHRDRNGLNNQRFNLRTATHQQNLRNSDQKYRGRSPFKGVSVLEVAQGIQYQASIRIDKRKTYLGIFNDPILAAMAYDKAARQHFGEFARTNF